MKLFQLFESKELATELLWFRRFISENDLETEIEVEGDKLVVYQDGKELCKWDAAEANRMRIDVLTDASKSSSYADNVLASRFELGEPVIATNAAQSRFYAEYILKGRFELGEPVIATSALHSRWYAQSTLNSHFELGEPIIATNAYQSRCYAEFALKGRFKLGEKVIATNAEETQKYKEFLATLNETK